MIGGVKSYNSKILFLPMKEILMSHQSKEIRVRFAPSPTGHLHMGSVRVAIFNWLFARHNNGKYLLRIEDTDLQRSKPEYTESILSSLKWLNLLPDEPVIYQLSRIDEHKKVLDSFLEKGLAYPCFCDPEELEKRRAENMQAGITPKYDGCCRNKKYTKEDLQKPHAIRFKLPEDIKFIEFDDAIRGNIKIESEQLDDFVIARQGGIPTYNFVVVLDDIFMKISHIIRGEDHISNTPKQILIYNALGADVPVFAHLPLILGLQGQRLSKRDAAVDVQAYKNAGFLADAFFNYLVRLGWAHGDQEVFTKDEMIKYFKLEDIGKKGSIFDIKKLEWLNGVYIRELSFEKFLSAVEDLPNNYKKELEDLWDTEKLKMLFEQYNQRATRLLDLVVDIISLAKAPKVLDLDLIKKWINNNSYDLIKEFLCEFENLKDFNNETLSNLAKDLCSKFDMKLVALAQPLRLALTGKVVSPGVFELMLILDKDDVINRINLLLQGLKKKD